MPDPTPDPSAVKVETPYVATIDWAQFWATAEDNDREGANPSAMHADAALASFIEETSVTGAIADVGCGAGVAAFHIAERFPGRVVVGYDAAEPVLDENRMKARADGVDNVRFERAVLPSFDPDRRFGVVFSYFTLCYVRDVEAALRNLYDAVEPGGYLVFNYQNRYARAHWRELAEAPEEYIDQESAFDPDRFAERFATLLEGDSVLSYRRIQEVLGAWPQSVWTVVERPDKQWAWRHHPLVYVPK